MFRWKKMKRWVHCLRGHGPNTGGRAIMPLLGEIYYNKNG